MATSVVGALVPQIRQAEIVRARHKPTESLDAHISHMRGVASFHTWSREGIETALKHLRRAIELDPNYSAPYGIAVSCHVVRKAAGWMTDPEADIAETRRLAAKGEEVGHDDCFALSSSGFAIANILGELSLRPCGRCSWPPSTSGPSWSSDGWPSACSTAGWTSRGVELSEVQKQAGRRGERTVFLLGVWRKESDP